MSVDGTAIAYHSLGDGPGLVIVGGVLSDGSDYLHLAEALADRYTVHVMERRGRPGSGPQRPGARHRGRVRRSPRRRDRDRLASSVRAQLRRPGRARNGQAPAGLRRAVRRRAGSPPARAAPDRLSWFDGYRQRLESGDRRGAFAWMVKNAGMAPRPVTVMPLLYLRFVLRLAIRGPKWERMDRLLEANLVEHRLQAALDAPSPDRFAKITARSVLMGGAKSPDSISGPLLHELARVIGNSTVAILPGLGHLAPEDHPGPTTTALLARADGLSRGA